jgi:uncharacterized membrane protein
MKAIKLKELFDYCVYRIAYTLKRETGYPLYMDSANFAMCMAITAYALALLHLVLYLFQVKVRFGYSLVAFLSISLVLHFITYKGVVDEETMFRKYLKHKEKNRWRKGLFVFLFLLFSWVSYFGTAIIFLF